MSGIAVAPRAGAWVGTSKMRQWADKPNVAPRAGAWVGTICLRKKGMPTLSHPVRVRGLEHLIFAEQGDDLSCRTPCGCVGWNDSTAARSRTSCASHPVRVRGLEQADDRGVEAG